MIDDLIGDQKQALIHKLLVPDDTRFNTLLITNRKCPTTLLKCMTWQFLYTKTVSVQNTTSSTPQNQKKSVLFDYTNKILTTHIHIWNLSIKSSRFGINFFPLKCVITVRSRRCTVNSPIVAICLLIMARPPF